jgi:hypothetical protein
VEEEALTIVAGPLLSSLVDLEQGAARSAAHCSFIPLVISVAGFLLALLLSLRLKSKGQG